MPIANQEMIRDNNRRLVLEYIVNNPPVSRAALSKQLKLTKATISAIVQDLLAQNLILEIGSAKTSLGRKPILLEFNQQYGYALAIDVRPRQILTLISDLKGENCHVQEYPFPPEVQLLPLLSRIIQETLEQYEQKTRKVLGISIGIYGVVQKNQVLFTPSPPGSGPSSGGGIPHSSSGGK